MISIGQVLTNKTGFDGYFDETSKSNIGYFSEKYEDITKGIKNYIECVLKNIFLN